jgi:succinate dehydrogenase/fumarate reductase flavoprotein subunit
MTGWQEFIAENGHIPEWPYPIRYEVENEISVDVLVLGGGIAGCHAAINAARKGARVAVCDTAPIIVSGQGGAGVDHWHCATTNPGSKVTPEEMTEALVEAYGGYDCGIKSYIQCKESYDALLDCENMGVQVRDISDEFKGAEFRDDNTKLMYAYDYENRCTIRVVGAKMKYFLYKELKRLGIDVFDWVKATSLLTEGGKTRAKVVGATGVNVRTGEFYIFKAKATILSMGNPFRLWGFVTEWRGFGSVQPGEPNCVGDGIVMAWNVGAELAMMEKTSSYNATLGLPNYGSGNCDNTWYACTMVDSNGKEIPWVDANGKILTTVSQRYRPAPGQKFFLPGMYASAAGKPYKYKDPRLIPDLPDRINKGEFVLPLYADLPSMPEHERRAIFGLMVGNEGKTRFPIYLNYTRAGFDPDKDMLQAPVEGARMSLPQWRNVGFQSSGGLVIDWDLKTNLEGLYTAGQQMLGGGDHSNAATSGRYAGRKAAEYARKAPEVVVNRRQIEGEKTRVYNPIKRTSGTSWKELNIQISRIMQDYCGKYKHKEMLNTGLRWFKDIRKSEASNLYARNPHELGRALDCLTLITVGEIIIYASLMRKASSSHLDFHRLDYPEMDPKEWHKFITIKLQDGEVKAGELPMNYWLLPPYAPTYEENYQRHCSL